MFVRFVVVWVMDETERFEEYKFRGDYHDNIDSDWLYYPIYKAKMCYVFGFLDKIARSCHVLDVGCGEGLIVKKYREKGFNFVGMDLNYKSEFVNKGDIKDMPFESDAFDITMCLDVLEHLSFSEQYIAINELWRVTQKGGRAIISVPNLAHVASRFRFMFLGEPFRTALDERRHQGDRTFKEFERMFLGAGWKVEKIKSLFPTFPLISLITKYVPRWSYPVHKFYNLFKVHPSLCFLTIFILTKTDDKGSDVL